MEVVHTCGNSVRHILKESTKSEDYFYREVHHPIREGLQNPTLF